MYSEDLFLNYCGLRQLTDGDIYSERYQRAKCAYLKRNLLKELPQTIGLLTALVQLHVVANELEQLPDELGHLRSLEVLDVAENLLQALPQTLGRLKNLKKLSVGGNRLEALPKEVGNLKQLTSLSASRNELTSVPVELSGCERLTVLALDKNQLTSVPRQLGRLQALSELSLCGNRLEYLPQCFSQMPSLQCLYLDNNPGFSHFTDCFNLSNLRSLGLNGCFSQSPDLRLSERFQHIPSRGGPVAIAEEISHVCVGSGDSSNCAPPLYELSLRTVAGCVNSNYGVERLPVPQTCKESLRDPTATCAQCSTKIFTFACVDIYYVFFAPANRSIAKLIYCCTQQCLNTFTAKVT